MDTVTQTEVELLAYMLRESQEGFCRKSKEQGFSNVVLRYFNI